VIEIPRSEQMRELARLLGQGDELSRRLSNVDVEQRAATDRAAAASAAVAQIEQEAALGVEISPKVRKDAESELAAAKALVASNWTEKRAGIAAAVRSHEARIRAYVVENAAALLGELGEDAVDAATALDAAAQGALDAYGRRMAVEQQTFALLALSGRSPDPDAIVRSRSDAFANEARRLLELGGERAPLLRDVPIAMQPGQPEVVTT
jgi:hypothetical protein